MMPVLLLAASLLSVFYAALMLYYTIGWSRIQKFEPSSEEACNTQVTVIIPARNEEGNIAALLDDLVQQNYPASLLQIVVVDDGSTDKTAEVASRYAGVDVIRVTHEKGTVAYKKRAIVSGIEQARGTLIVTTDADCRVSPNWIRSIALYHQHTGAVFISSPVTMHYHSGFFDGFQILEFAGLVGIGAGAIAMQMPNMCNGANVAYLKEAFYTVGGFTGNDHIASGDDEFLMHKMHNAYPGKVSFLKSTDAIVQTNTCVTLGSFIHQRMRWVSKSTKYTDKRITLILAFSYLFNLSIVLLFVAGVFNAIALYTALLLLILKCITEGILIRRVVTFFGTRHLFKWFIPSQILHIFYVLFIGIAGNLFSYEWKGRKV